MKIAMIGPNNVGKSAIVVRYVMHLYFDKYDPTIEDAYRVDIRMNNTNHSVNIFDIGADIMKYKDIIEQCDGFICVYSATSSDSYRQLDEMIHQLYAIKSRDNIKLVIVGNKNDLYSEIMVNNMYGYTLAQKYGTAYIAVSAKMNSNIDDVYNHILKKCV